MAEVAVKTPSKAEAGERPTEWRPLTALRQEIDRLFEEFPWRPFFPRNLFEIEPIWRGATWGVIPATDVVEKEKEYQVTAELPGMDESNIEVKFSDGLLTIKGEKREEKEEKEKNYYLSERRYGSFQRCLQIPTGIDTDKIEATFSKGVLTVHLPKTVEAQKQEKKIAIKKA